ncbi:MAG: glucose-6-phosphate isomerase, partial [Gammaproteobacteria bacterium]
ASKSFTTLETRQNYQRAQDWLLAGGCPAAALEQHFLAATARPQAALAAGINSDRIFSFDTSIGGRYSIWSIAGLTAMLAIGPRQYDEFLQGAAALDTHFVNSDPGTNMPVILALLDIWYRNFFNTAARAVVPYEQRLADLPAYLTQLFMESNGKSVSRDGQSLSWQTGGVIFGGTGTTVQHSFFQSLHQGTTMIPVDFLVASQGDSDHAALFASCVAQARALMLGATDSSLPAHQVCHGNRPSNLLLYENLTPYVLGMLLALYEQRAFVQACLWNINPFDQWGVELGKQIAGDLQDKLTGTQKMADADDDLGDDSSTRRLLQHYRHNKNRK